VHAGGRADEKSAQVEKSCDGKTGGRVTSAALPLRTMLPPSREQDLQQELAWCPRSVSSQPPPCCLAHRERAHVYNYATCAREFREQKHTTRRLIGRNDPFLHRRLAMQRERCTKSAAGIHPRAAVGNLNFLASSSNPRVVQLKK
jgi:hypothetical protein